MNAYCDECGTDTCDDRYHQFWDCDECGAEDTVECGAASGNPEDGDEWFCSACGASGPY